MKANGSKSYLPYLNKLVDQYNITYHHSINKKLVNADYSALTEKTQANPKPPKFKANEFRSIRVFSVKVTLKIDQVKYLLLILF